MNKVNVWKKMEKSEKGKVFNSVKHEKKPKFYEGEL